MANRRWLSVLMFAAVLPLGCGSSDEGPEGSSVAGGKRDGVGGSITCGASVTSRVGNDVEILRESIVYGDTFTAASSNEISETKHHQVMTGARHLSLVGNGAELADVFAALNAPSIEVIHLEYQPDDVLLVATWIRFPSEKATGPDGVLGVVFLENTTEILAQVDEPFIVGCEAASSEPESEYPIHLDRSTTEEVATYFAKRMTQQLNNCFADYQQRVSPDAKMITANVMQEFRSNYPYDGRPEDDYCYDTYDLMSIGNELLELKGRTRVYPETMASWYLPWAIEQLQPATVDGYVGYKDLPTLFYYDVKDVKANNAMRREKNPTSVDLKEIRTIWKKVGSGNLDKNYHNPVRVDPATIETDLFNQMRKLFVGSLDYVSYGNQAIDDFWNSQEGPEGDPEFAPIAQQLKKSSIKKRFYFAGGGWEPFGWSRNVLIVLDEHDQMYGLEMGYSE